MTLVYVYFVCLIAGVAYAILATIFSGIGGDVDASGVDVDAGLDIDIGDGDLGGEVHLSPVSPIVIATFLASFGGGGLVAARGFALSTWPSLVVATLSGFAFGALAFFLFYKIYSITQSSSEAHVESLVGTQAEVITPIRPDTLGEVAYIARGTRYNSPARSEDNTTIMRGRIVTITKVVGGSLVVRENAEA
jgi:membrane-bound ClpP family serine protease